MISPVTYSIDPKCGDNPHQLVFQSIWNSRFPLVFHWLPPPLPNWSKRNWFCFITVLQLVTNLNIMQIILNKQQSTHFDSRYHLLREIFKTTASVFIFEIQLSLNASSFPGRYSVEIKSDDGYQIGLRISSFITPRIISSGSPCINWSRDTKSNDSYQMTLVVRIDIRRLFLLRRNKGQDTSKCWI